MSETNVRLDDIMPLIRERLAAGESVQFTPRGTSMLPMILGGRDQVVLSPLPRKLKKYDLPLYQRDNGQYVLHRIVKVAENYTCIGDNQLTREPNVRPDQMIALATSFIRKGKAYEVSSLSYQLYCRLWHHTRPLRRLMAAAKYKLRRIFSRE